MVFSARAPGERPKSLAFRTNPSKADESSINTYAPPLSPIRNLNLSSMPPPPAPNDVRNSLQRRFTTNALPSLAPIGEQRKQSNERGDGGTKQAYNRISPAEQRARQYEALLEQQRNIQAQMNMIDPELRREVDEARKLEQDINHFTSSVLNEPGSPPNAHPTFTNRFSTPSLASPGVLSHLQSQVTSPPSTDLSDPYFPSASSIPSQSMPASQRNSDHEESDEDQTLVYRPKAGANPNRISLPVTAFDLRNKDLAFSPVAKPANGAGLHFADDDGRTSKRSSGILTTSPDAKTFLQLHQTDDKFPILVRRGTDNISTFSGPGTPLESAEGSKQEAYPRTEHTVAARHRQSLPPGIIRNSGIFSEGISGLGSILSDSTTAKNTAANRRSLEVNFAGMNDPKSASLLMSPQKAGLNNNKVPSSYSTNDIPTLKSITHGLQDNKHMSASQTPTEGKISPLQALQDSPIDTFSTSSATNQQSAFPSDMDPLHRHPSNGAFGGAPFFNAIYRPLQHDASAGAAAHVGAMQHYGQPNPSMNNFGMEMQHNNFGGMGAAPSRGPWQAAPFQQGFQSYGPYGAAPGQAARYEASSRPPSQRRGTQSTVDENNRYANVPLDAVTGEIPSLCKDQFGCRFLQKKLEDQNPENIRKIFDETLPHVVDLMTDPFGNYLCQKLLEYANDEQRTTLIAAATDQMVRIALNQHGTRALQKMIEFVNTQQQIDMITRALKDNVVQLIQDLNGNHVIQKCLNHLSQDNMQFIVDSVCAHVVAVGTHRHGCCVLQRCVDHASSLQKGQLVSAITHNVLPLVQDPFGNYVVQYILDLGEPAFTEPICNSMVGSLGILARQKFSSNVIEKGIRTASEETRRRLIDELLQPSELQKMIRDSFANYVVQTAMEYADDETKAHLFDLIRPMLPSIRHTPHGRRIQSKIQDYDARRAESMGMPMASRDMSMTPQYQGYPVGPGGQFGHAPFGPNNNGMMPYGYQPPHPGANTGGPYAYGNGQQNRMPNFSTVGRGGPHGMNFF